MKSLNLARREGGDKAKRMNLSFEQGILNVHVSDPGDIPLIHQETLDGSRLPERKDANLSAVSFLSRAEIPKS